MTPSASQVHRSLPKPWDRFLSTWGPRLAWVWRRWHAGVWSAAVSFICVWGLGPQAWQESVELEQELALLQTRQAQVSPAQAVAWVRLPDALNRLPGQAQQAALATALERLFVQQGLHWTSMRWQPASKTSPLPSQTVTVRLESSFEAWAQAWTQWQALGPVVSMERVGIQPAVQGPGVQIDAVLRFWMLPGEEGAKAWPHALDTLLAQGSVVRQAQPSGGAALFAPSEGAQVALAAAASRHKDATGAGMPPVRSNQPHDWPLASVRLLGVWQQAQQLHAVLAAGPHWARVQVGQQVTQEGHCVLRITEQSVTLRAGQGGLHELEVQGGFP